MSDDGFACAGTTTRAARRPRTLSSARRPMASAPAKAGPRAPPPTRHRPPATSHLRPKRSPSRATSDSRRRSGRSTTVRAMPSRSCARGCCPADLKHRGQTPILTSACTPSIRRSAPATTSEHSASVFWPATEQEADKMLGVGMVSSNTSAPRSRSRRSSASATWTCTSCST